MIMAQVQENDLSIKDNTTLTLHSYFNFLTASTAIYVYTDRQESFKKDKIFLN